MTRRVVVIFQSPDYAADAISFPPVGAKGTAITEFDSDDECDVEFDEYPCPVGIETSWITHKAMIVFVDDPDETRNDVESVELVEKVT
jgi:hypothetical protein